MGDLFRSNRPDVVVIMTDQERAAPPYESDELREWRRRTLAGARWFEDHGVSFMRHYTGSLACVPSRPTLFTGQYPDVHGVTQTDGLGKMWDDSRMRWLRPGEVPTLGHWFRAAGYDTCYQGKWHMSHADLVDSATGGALATNDNDGFVDEAAERAYRDADPLGVFGFSGWIGPEPHGPSPANAGLVRDPLIADRVVAWLQDRYGGHPSAVHHRPDRASSDSHLIQMADFIAHSAHHAVLNDCGIGPADSYLRQHAYSELLPADDAPGHVWPGGIDAAGFPCFTHELGIRGYP